MDTDYQKFTGVLITFLILILFVMSYPVSIETNTYDLVIKEKLDESQLNVSHKMNVSGGLVQHVFNNISFIVEESDKKQISKTIEYDGDITYIASDKNTISYKEKRDILKRILSYEDITIEYDASMFEK